MTPDNWKGGSLPLRLLKKLGYQIHVYSSARLSYFNMDQLIFGESRYLVDRFPSFEGAEFEEVHQKDQGAVDLMIREVQQSEASSGRVFLVFLDATHHDYSWPMDTDSVFHPFEPQVNYFKAAVSNNSLEGIRNRYRNALHFVDGLFGKFAQALHTIPGGREAIVVVTGDHAEEFYEQGYLFHASALSHQQTHVPLYYKFGESERAPQLVGRKLSSHIDIFPSIFHYLFGEDLFSEVLHGQSIFNSDYWPYVVTARFNASRSPYEFSIHNGTDKIIARFEKQSDIFNSSQLQIISAKTLEDEHLPIDLPSIRERFGEAIDRIFRP
jgi:membrane-anchored protein YejM (alkaline phosphatase superfamily)